MPPLCVGAKKPGVLPMVSEMSITIGGGAVVSIDATVIVVTADETANQFVSVALVAVTIHVPVPVVVRVEPETVQRPELTTKVGVLLLDAPPKVVRARVLRVRVFG